MLSLGLQIIADAQEPVTMLPMPAITGEANPTTYTLQIKMSNPNLEDCQGNLMVGGPSKRSFIPIQLRAKESKTIIAYCPVYFLPIHPNDRNSDGGNFTDLELTTTFKSGTSHNSYHYLVPSRYMTTISVSRRRNSLAYLEGAKKVRSNIYTGSNPKAMRSSTAKDTPGLGAPSSFSTRLDEEMRLGQTVCVLTPDKPVDRVSAFTNTRSIFLGEGSASLSDAEVAALKEYLVNGGSIVVGNTPDSAISDPRWTNIVGKPGYDSDWGKGRIINLGFDPDPVKPTQDLRYRYLKRVDFDKTPGRYFGPPNPEQSVSFGGSDPFSVQLPSFGQICSVLGAYFLMVVPLNYFVLRKLQRLEIMWITAPILALIFSGAIFRSAGKLYDSSMSVDVYGHLMCEDDLPQAVFSGTFALFTPKAQALNLNLRKTTVEIGSANDDFRTNVPEKLPDVIDTGSINVPAYRSANLQFKNFMIEQVFDNPHLVKFTIVKGKDGVDLVCATNTSGVQIAGARLVAGEFSSNGDRSLRPGETITLPVTDLDPLPELTFKLKTSQNGLLSVPGGPQDSAKDWSLFVQSEGRIALFGTAVNYPLGPDIGPKCVYRSNVNISCFASKSLKLP